MRGRDPLDVDGLAAPAITAAGDIWAVVDTEDGDVWLRGADAADRGADDGHGRRGRAGSPAGTDVYLADETALVRVPADGSAVGDRDRAAAPAVLGTPAQPIVHDGEVYAAWLGQGEAGGVLWRSGGGAVDLDYGAETLPDQRRRSSSRATRR